MSIADRNPRFVCLECGYKFKTLKAAERAAFGDSGCPKCGGSDIDMDYEIHGHAVPIPINDRSLPK